MAVRRCDGDPVHAAAGGWRMAARAAVPRRDKGGARRGSAPPPAV
jgi:hypothetical protein